MTNRRQFLTGLLAGAAGGRLRAADPNLPNVLLIVADDLGWADVGYHGSPLRTPNIDRLARSGAELHHHYAAPVCSPTRCGLLSGRYWSRFNVTSPQATQAMPFGTVTLASALKSRGYETAITGKWHLGSLPEWGPRKFGFDHSYGALGGGTGPWDHRYKKGPYTRNWHRDDEYVDEEGHVTDLIAREAIAFLEKRRSAPFFLYVPFTAVHHPIDEPARWLEANRNIEEPRRQYAACVQHMDDAVGRLIAALERNGLRRNTLVVFTSDNGGMGVPANDLDAYPGDYAKGGILGQNQPLRGHKAQVYEGGIRVPAFVNFPGRVAARKIEAPVCVVDWLPTLAKLAGFQPERDPKWDGRDIWPVIAGGRPASRDLYWKGPGGRAFAMRSEDWKLVVTEPAGGKGRVQELFNLRDDPYEQRDRAAAEPETVAKLDRLLARERSLDNDAVVRR